MLDPTLRTPKEEIRSRISRFQEHLVQEGLDGALLVQTSDLFYFSGTIQQAHLYIPAGGAPLLMARKNFNRAAFESPIDAVVPLSSPKSIPGLIADHGLPAPKSLGLELDVLPANLYFLYSRIFEGVKISDVSHAVRLTRAIKSAFEVDQIEIASGFADRVAAGVPKLAREGMTELELAGLLEARARAFGHQGTVRMRLFNAELFYGHLLCGPDGAVPSYLSSPTGGPGVGPSVAQGSSFNTLKRNEPLLVDYVFIHRGYVADHARIFAIGKLSDELTAAHEAMLALEAEIMAFARPGVPAGSVYDFALSWCEERGYGEWFMGAEKDRIRFVGHGVGLELDEYPFLASGQDMPLEEGMVIALEPKLVIPGKGVVGVENTQLVTPDGLRPLTRFPGDVTPIPL